MTEYKSVAAFVQRDGEVIFAVSTETLDDHGINQLASELGSERKLGWWIIRAGKLSAAGLAGLCRAIASNPHWLTLESGESEEKERK